MKIPERTLKSRQGLEQFCEYIGKFHDTKKLSILEIGSWTGVSAEIFARYFEKVYCVDPWEPTSEISLQYDMKEVEKIFDERIKKYNNIIKHKKKSKDYWKDCQLYDGICYCGMVKYDVIYIDGLHAYKSIKEDIELWNQGAEFFIAGHDYCNKFPDVMKAVNEKFKKPDKIFPDTTWIINKEKTIPRKVRQIWKEISRYYYPYDEEKREELLIIIKLFDKIKRETYFFDKRRKK